MSSPGPPGETTVSPVESLCLGSSANQAVLTRISSADGLVDVAFSLEDRDSVVDHVVIGVKRKRGRKVDLIKFVVQGGLPSKRS